jgi:galactokinase
LISRLAYQGDLTDCSHLARRLANTGLSSAACQAKAALFAKAAAALDGRPSVASKETHAFFVPGRIEILGKHTDYAGGSSVVVAAERGFALVARPRSDRLVRVGDAKSGESVEVELNPQLVPQVGHWSNYPATVARRMARNFPEARRGAEIAFASDLPPAAGMSSSSALMVAIFLALADVNQLAASRVYQENIHNPTDLAGYLGTVENGQTFGTLVGDRGVGTFGGSEDHTAILCGRPQHVSQYAYCPVRFQRAIPIPEGYTFAVASSGVVAEKTGRAMELYNAASRLARELVEVWNAQTGRTDPHLAAIVASSPQADWQLSTIVDSLPTVRAQSLQRRLKHFLHENQTVLPAAGDALAAGDLEAFGRWVDQSQQGAEQLLGNQVPETCTLAAAARQAGAVAASAFGAGFGGGVWALVAEPRAEAFVTAWRETYSARFPQREPSAVFFLTCAGPAAFQV